MYNVNVQALKVSTGIENDEGIMSLIAISRLNFFAEVSEKDFNSDKHLEKVEELTSDLKGLLNKYGFEYDSVETTFLSKNKYSILRCEQCDHLMIDRVENPVRADIEDLVADIIFDGAKYEKKYLCEDCLPVNHRWSTR